jgi:phage/plasmid-associated DNA primase
MRLLKCCAGNFDEASVRAAQYIPCLNATVDDLDKNPWLLNVENGMVDLNTGELLPLSTS